MNKIKPTNIIPFSVNLSFKKMAFIAVAKKAEKYTGINTNKIKASSHVNLGSVGNSHIGFPMFILM